MIGLHDWHEHEVYVPVFHKVVHPNGRTLPYWDRVCLRPDCKLEDRKASRLWAKDTARREKRIAAESLLRTAPNHD